MLLGWDQVVVAFVTTTTPREKDSHRIRFNIIRVKTFTQEKTISQKTRGLVESSMSPRS